VIVVGEQTISYHSMTWDTLECVVAQPTIFECYTPVDSEDSSEEWILGDADGRIYCLSLSSNDLTLTKLGEVVLSPSIPSSRPNVFYVVLYSLRPRRARLLNPIHRLPLRRLPHSNAKTNPPPQPIDHHQSGPYLRFPCPASVTPPGRRSNNLFRGVWPRDHTRCPPRRRDRGLCCRRL